MSNYRPIDSKREEFRKYLEQGGVMDALTKVLVSLYEESEKPTDPLDYVKKNLGGGADGGDDLQGQLEEKNTQIAGLETQVGNLKQKLLDYEPAGETDVQAPPADAPPADAPPETAADGAPDAPADNVTPEVTPEVTPDEVAPDAVPDDAAPEVAPDAKPEETPAEA